MNKAGFIGTYSENFREFCKIKGLLKDHCSTIDSNKDGEVAIIDEDYYLGDEFFVGHYLNCKEIIILHFREGVNYRSLQDLLATFEGYTILKLTIESGSTIEGLKDRT